MSELDELIRVTNSICENLNKCSQNEKKFCDDICHELERMTQNMEQMKRDLISIKSFHGGI